MQFIVDEKRKKKMQNEVRKSNKAAYITYLIEKIVLFGTLLGSLAFVLNCLLTGDLVSVNMDTGEKGYFLVITLSAVLFSVGMTAWIIIYVLRKRLELVFVRNKVQDSLEIQDDKLFYLFRIKYETSESNMNFIMIDLHKMSDLTFDNDTGKISISGQIIQKNLRKSVKNYELNENEMTQSTVEFFDYFTPSIYEVIKEYPVV